MDKTLAVGSEMSESDAKKLKAYDRLMKGCARMGVLPGAGFYDSAKFGTYRSGKVRMGKKERRAVKHG